MITADTPGRRLVMLRRAVGHPSLGSAAALGFVLSASWSDPTLAVGLGTVTQQSALGQSLRVVVPVIVSPGEDIAAECFRLAASDREVDGVPQLAFGRMSLERTAAGARLVITNARPVNDPVLRLTVQAGCETAVRREYVLLMDPLPIETPLAAAESEPRTDVAQTQPPPVAAAAPARGARGGVRAETGGATRVTGEAGRAARNAPPPKARPPAKAVAKRPARAATEKPRLTVSGAAPLITTDARGPNASDAEQARAQQELTNAIEAETVVLRQRIVELTAMVERMQEEVRANELAQRAAEEAAKAAPMSKAAAWWDANWPLLSAIVGLPLALAAALLWRRRQQGKHEEDWQTARAASIPAEPVPPVADPRLQNAAAGVPATIQRVEAPPKRVPRRTPIARDGASALAVSELLHVTEEARVYVALGHPERAIGVLNEHIRQVPRSMPAAWLMLLDLYHASSRRQDFRRLAEEFHLHCNVQAPVWESFHDGEPDDGGLETFPHVLRQVASIWRQPGCREYLEGLLYDNREGRRMGFPLAAYSDILLLLQILDAPPVVDIDSDLIVDGKLEPIPKRATAAVSSRSDNPQSVEPSRVSRTGSTEAATRPSQRPLDLDPDQGEGAPEGTKKLSS